MEVTHASRSSRTYLLDLRIVGKNEITSIHDEGEVYSTVPADGAATLDIDLSKLNDFDGAFQVATNEGTTHIGRHDRRGKLRPRRRGRLGL